MSELFNISNENAKNLSDSDLLALVKKIVKSNWNDGISIVFQKKDGSLRTMAVKLNESLLAPKTEKPAPGTEARRATNKINGNLVVTEWLKDTDSYQIRTIPLLSVISIETL